MSKNVKSRKGSFSGPPMPTALVSAVYKNDMETVTALLEQGVDINEKTECGNTPLIYAVTYGHAGMVDLLIRLGADIESKNNSGQKALHFAEWMFGRGDLVRLIREASALQGRLAAEKKVKKSHVIREAMTLRRDLPYKKSPFRRVPR